MSTHFRTELKFITFIRFIIVLSSLRMSRRRLQSRTLILLSWGLREIMLIKLWGIERTTLAWLPKRARSAYSWLSRLAWVIRRWNRRWKYWVRRWTRSYRRRWRPFRALRRMKH